MIRSTLQSSIRQPSIRPPSLRKHRALPPCDEPLRSLWDPDAEPADAFVAWLERKLACCRAAARRPQVTGPGSPSIAPAVSEAIEAAPLR